MKNTKESVPNPCTNSVSRSTVQFDIEPALDKFKGYDNYLSKNHS